MRLIISLLASVWIVSSALAQDGLKLNRLRLSSEAVLPGEVVRAQVEATSASGRAELLKYYWDANGGTLTQGANPAEISWRAPARPGTYLLGVTVAEGRTSATKQVSVVVKGDVAKTPPTLAEQEAQRRAIEDQQKARVQELRAQIAKRGTYQDYLRADMARDELGFTLLEQHSYEEAARVFSEGLETLPFDSPKAKPFNLGRGIALYHLNKQAEALEALKLAGDYNTSRSYFIQGKIHERANRKAEAMESYRKSAAADRRNSEPVYQMSRLLIADKNYAGAAQLLIDHSPAIGRTTILQQLEGDASLKPALDELRRTDKLNALQDRKPFTMELAQPTKAERPKAPD